MTQCDRLTHTWILGLHVWNPHIKARVSNVQLEALTVIQDMILRIVYGAHEALALHPHTHIEYIVMICRFSRHLCERRVMVNTRGKGHGQHEREGSWSTREGRVMVNTRGKGHGQHEREGSWSTREGRVMVNTRGKGHGQHEREGSWSTREGSASINQNRLVA